MNVEATRLCLVSGYARVITNPGGCSVMREHVNLFAAVDAVKK